jgi:hypothetical protein
VFAIRRIRSAKIKRGKRFARRTRVLVFAVGSGNGRKYALWANKDLQWHTQRRPTRPALALADIVQLPNQDPGQGAS